MGTLTFYDIRVVKDTNFVLSEILNAIVIYLALQNIYVIWNFVTFRQTSYTVFQDRANNDILNEHFTIVLQFGGNGINSNTAFLIKYIIVNACPVRISVLQLSQTQLSTQICGS